MNNGVKNRVKEILQHKQTNINKLSQELGIPQTTINRQINGNSEIQTQTVVAILDYFKEVNAEWLLTGKGNMLNAHQQIGNIENSTAIGLNINGNNNSFKIAEADIMKVMNNYQDIIKKQQEQIDELLYIIKNQKQ